MGFWPEKIRTFGNIFVGLDVLIHYYKLVHCNIEENSLIFFPIYNFSIKQIF